MDIVTRLEKTRDQTLRCFALSEDQLALSYGPGKWLVRFILHHLADAETVLYDRIRRAISEQNRYCGSSIRMRGQKCWTIRRRR